MALSSRLLIGCFVMQTVVAVMMALFGLKWTPWVGPRRASL